MCSGVTLWQSRLTSAGSRWPAGEEYLRPSLTPTTLGLAEPVRRLLAQTMEP